MKFFKNHTVAVVIAVLVIAGCCIYGFVTRPNETAADLEPLAYGRENYEAYLGWIDDGADLLSEDTEREVATYMAAMDQAYGSIVALVTDPDAGGDLAQRAYDRAIDGQLSGRDMILLLDAASDNWYMLPGEDIGRYVDSDLQAIVTGAFGGGSVVRDADGLLPELYRDMFTWYQDTLEPVDAGPSVGSVVAVLVVILLVLAVVFASMGVGSRRYGGYGFWGPFWGPIFFPMRFPGGPIRPRHPPRRDPGPFHGDDHHGGFGGGGFGGGFGGFGGGGFGGGGRGGGFGGGGGGFGGGGFGGGGRGGGFGG